MDVRYFQAWLKCGWCDWKQPRLQRERKRRRQQSRQWNHSLYQFRKRRHIGPKSRESPPPGRMKN